MNLNGIYAHACDQSSDALKESFVVQYLQEVDETADFRVWQKEQEAPSEEADKAVNDRLRYC